MAKNVECLNNVYSVKISLYNPIELVTENNQFCITCLINSEANCRVTLNQAIARVAAEYLQNISPDTSGDGDTTGCKILKSMQIRPALL